jgi:hypothetical protein
MPDFGLGGVADSKLEVQGKIPRVPTLVEKDGLLPPRNPRKERKDAQKAKAKTAGPKW